MKTIRIMVAIAMMMISRMKIIVIMVITLMIISKIVEYRDSCQGGISMLIGTDIVLLIKLHLLI